MSDPAIAAERFRIILDAMARPGVPQRISLEDAPPEPLSAAAAAVVTTLVDGDAPCWFAPRRRTPAALRMLRFSTGSAAAEATEDARFLLGAWSELAEIDAAIGEPEYPDRSATLILEVDGFGADAFAPGFGADLTGPGVRDKVRLVVDGVDERFWPRIAENAARFPLGFDLILTAGDQIVGLPRSTQPEPK